jgi:hypothetical protein
MHHFWILGLVCAAAPDLASAGPPRAETFLLEGRLAEGEIALAQHLNAQPTDDQARFGLGFVQFLRTFERFAQGLHQYGLGGGRVGTDLRAAAPDGTPLHDLLTPNKHPEALSYPAFRKLFQNALDDLKRAEATLAAIKDPAVRLPLPIGRIRLDLSGWKRPVAVASILGTAGLPVDPKQAKELVIVFDRGDVCWLRGYCHFLAGSLEILQSLDARELFEASAHLLFAKPETPYPFLNSCPAAADADDFDVDVPLWTDLFAYIHLLLRVPLTEPARLKAAHAHLEAMLAMSDEMWVHYLAETDDDHEWIPNPKQTGVLRVPVRQEMIDTWRESVREARRVLRGERLIPFWRGQPGEHGLNLRRVFLEPPKSLDAVLWVQGTAAAAYLEKGPITPLADPQMIGQINNVFGGMNFFGFLFWFN